MAKDFIDKVALIHIRDKKILMAQSAGKDVFYTPGGKRNNTETDADVLIREIKEELCADLLPETIKYYGTFIGQAHAKPEGTKVRMACYIAEFDDAISPGAEIQNLAYLAYSQRHLTGQTDQLIFDDLKSKNLID
jgi:ADP-ribose pyrophosphatase YjhB (NUDIX family)